MTDPQTPTGRRVLEEWEDEGGQDDTMRDAILAIEAEAAAPADALLRALVVKRMPGLTREERAAEFAQRKAAARAYLDAQK